MSNPGKARRPAKPELVVLDDEEPTSQQPPEKRIKVEEEPVSSTISPSPPITQIQPSLEEVQQQLEKSERMYQRACRATREAELRANAAEKLLDSKRGILNNSKKELDNELEKRLSELSKQLEEARRSANEAAIEFRRKEEIASNRELELIRENDSLKVEMARLRRSEEMANSMKEVRDSPDKKDDIVGSSKKIADLEKKLSDVSKQLDEAKRAAEDSKKNEVVLTREVAALKKQLNETNNAQGDNKNMRELAAGNGAVWEGGEQGGWGGAAAVAAAAAGGRDAGQAEAEVAAPPRPRVIRHPIPAALWLTKYKRRTGGPTTVLFRGFECRVEKDYYLHQLLPSIPLMISLGGSSGNANGDLVATFRTEEEADEVSTRKIKNGDRDVEVHSGRGNWPPSLKSVYFVDI